MKPLLSKRLGAALTVACLILVPRAGWCISETDFARIYAQEVLPFFQASPEKYFTGTRGAKIHYRVFEQAAPNAPAVVVVPGRTEPVRKFAEVLFDLHHRGFAVYAIDHRGQGLSDRMATPRDVGYVRDFQDYVRDLDRFATEVVDARASRGKKFLLAQSMGGAISAFHVIGNPSRYQAVAYAAPMFEVNTGKYSHGQAKLLATVATWFGLGKHFAIGYRGFDPNPEFQGNDSTQSEARFRVFPDAVREDPRLALGGPSYRWVRESLQATEQLEKLAIKHTAPTLILQAALDETVRPGGQNHFCSQAPRCRIETFADARHSILHEKDSIRNAAFEKILGFFCGAIIGRLCYP